jgi:transcriptional regulator with XRE-family HTH domain
MDTLANHLSTNLRHLRRSHQLSQEELAQQLGLNRGNIASYENGSAEPKLCNLLKIARFFQVSLMDITQHDLALGHSSSEVVHLGSNGRQRLNELYERSKDFHAFLSGLQTCYAYKAKSLRENGGLSREMEILMSYFDQLYEASAELAQEHQHLLELCRCKNHRTDKLS